MAAQAIQKERTRGETLLFIALLGALLFHGGLSLYGTYRTTLFGSVFITAPVIVLALLVHFRLPLADEPGAHPRYVIWRNWRALVARRVRRILPAVGRAGLFGIGTIFLLVIVVLPYWLWSRSDPITQVPVPHASRDNLLGNTSAGLVFWLIPYGIWSRPPENRSARPICAPGRNWPSPTKSGIPMA